MNNIVTPSDENGYCEYAFREEYDPNHGVITKCDYQGTCEYKEDKGVTNRKLVHVCNKIN